MRRGKHLLEGIMADNEFDLGEALGGYEQAQADRNFYLSMVQGGTQMASPIAAYLAGVSGVKMATMRQKAQAIQDERQAEKDAIAATERLQKRQSDLDNQIINIIKGARDGSIAPGAAAAMLGPLTKERGINLKQYDAENQTMIGNVAGDPQDYEWDLSERPSQLEAGRNKRAEERIAWEKEKQQRGIQGQKEVAAYKKSLGTGGSGQEKYITLSAFNSRHKDVISALGRKARMDRLTFGQIKDFVEGVESLSPKDKEQMEAKVDDILEYVRTAPRAKGWSFSTKSERQKSLNELWGQ